MLIIVSAVGLIGHTGVRDSISLTYGWGRLSEEWDVRQAG